MKNCYLLVSMLSIMVALISATQTPSWPCNFNQAVEDFKVKVILNKVPEYKVDPYFNVTPARQKDINETLANQNLFCGIQYEDDLKINYYLYSFSTKQQLIDANYTITHQGKCGACSTLQDLSIYLSQDLTNPVRRCGLITFFSQKRGFNCILKLGFSYPCAQIWFYNTIYTRQMCGTICMQSLILRRPNVKPDGSLNKCLQCDEDKSGPMFKFESGRTRRNSGIHSEIDRPNDQIYEMNHCYF